MDQVVNWLAQLLGDNWEILLGVLAFIGIGLLVFLMISDG